MKVSQKSIDSRRIELEGLVLGQVVEVKHKRMHDWQAFLLDDLQDGWQVTLAHRRHIEALAPVEQVENALQLLVGLVKCVHEQAIAILSTKARYKSCSIKSSSEGVLTIITKVPSFLHSPFKL